MTRIYGHWTRRDGKRIVYEVGMYLNMLAMLAMLIAFCTPYWIISWPRVYSGFRKVGLWEVCFAGYVLETDPLQKAYHGCWWILAPEFISIRQWLMPPWFIYTQVNVTLSFCAMIVTFIIHLTAYVKTGKTQRNPSRQNPKKPDPLNWIQAGCAITVSSAGLMAINMLVFGVMYKFDSFWLPHPFFNYLSWSYGMALVSMFFQIGASIAQIAFVLILRQELREPPKTVALAGFLPAAREEPVKLSASYASMPRS